NNNPIVGNIPTSPLGSGAAANPPYQSRRLPRPKPNKTPGIKNVSPKDLPDLGEEIAKNEKEKIEAEKKAAQDSNIEASKDEDDGSFNSRPLEDWGKIYGERILKKEIDVNAPFTVEVVAKLDEKGKLIKPQVTAKKDSDPKMLEVAKAGIAAFSDTNLLKPLYELGGRDIVITFSQDADNLQAIIKTKTPSPERANSLQSNLKLVMQGASNFMKEGSDEANLMSRAQLATDKNFLIINFLISNEEKTQLIEKNLRSLEEKLKKNQTNGGLAENKASVK
ncbi:MAG: hypothetical protein JWN60_3273, partial [Acidobacteria bacterium]|nr:hypothetical protein [Acidobacteriota bacterium]